MDDLISRQQILEQQNCPCCHEDSEGYVKPIERNCHDKSICCEDETGLCDYFEESLKEGEQDG